MNLRSWFHLGLSILGVYYVAEAFIGIPEVLVLLVAATGGQEASVDRTILISGVGPILFRQIVGVFLVLKARSLSRTFAKPFGEQAPSKPV